MPPTIWPLLMMVSVLQLHTHVLLFREELQRFESALASDAAFFRATEGNAQVAQQPAVDPDGAGVQRGGDAVGAFQVARPDRGRESVLGGVGGADGIGVVLEWRDGDDGAEDLFLQHTAVGSESGDDGGLEKVAGTVDAATAGNDATAFLFREREV